MVFGAPIMKCVRLLADVYAKWNSLKGVRETHTHSDDEQKEKIYTKFQVMEQDQFRKECRCKCELLISSKERKKKYSPYTHINGV